MGSGLRLLSRHRGTRADAAPTAARRAAGSAAAAASRSPRPAGRCRARSLAFPLDRRKPGATLPVLAGEDVEERLLDRLGHRARLAGADLAAVELADRRHFGRRAGEERLVGDVDVVARQALGA